MLNVAGQALEPVITATGGVLQATGNITVQAAQSLGMLIYQPPGAANAAAAAEEERDDALQEQQPEHSDDAGGSTSPDSMAKRATKRLMQPARAARDAVQSRVIEVAKAQAETAREEEEMGARDEQLEAEAKQRYEARLARQQAELRSGATRAPDTTRRVFQCRINSVACENVSGAPIDERFFVRFVLGAPALNHRSSGLDWAVGTQSALRTAAIPAGGLAAKGRHVFADCADDLRYWIGS